MTASVHRLLHLPASRVRPAAHGAHASGVSCLACYRAGRRAGEATEQAHASPAAPRSPFDVRPQLTARQVAHRQRMLAHLTQR